MIVSDNKVLQALTAWTESLSLPDRDVDDVWKIASAIDAYRAFCTEPAICEKLTQHVWIKVLEQYVAGNCEPGLRYYLSLVLLTRDRWREIPERDGLACVFMAMAIGVIEDQAKNAKHGSTAGVAIVSQLRQQLLAGGVSEWLPPGSDPTVTPLRDIAAALFGEHWCILVYDSARGQDVSFAELLAANRPAFLPGRLTSALGPVLACGLPDLVC